MVKPEMLISQFARNAALSVDTVRFYVRTGLLTPRHGNRGGRNPYMEFTADDLGRAHLIKIGQLLGMSLREIAAFLSASEADQIATLERHRDRLNRQIDDLRHLEVYLGAKIEWAAGGRQGDPPSSPAMGGGGAVGPPAIEGRADALGRDRRITMGAAASRSPQATGFQAPVKSSRSSP